MLLLTTKKKLKPQINDIEARIFYVDEWGIIYLRMPHRDYIKYKEQRLWNWWLPEIKVHYE